MPSLTPKPADNLKNFAEKSQEALNDNAVNCESDFYSDPNENIQKLAEAAFPNNPDKQEYYKTKILASLEAWLKEGISIQGLWTALETEYGCNKTKIIEGMLKFFSGEKGDKEINISKFLKPVEHEARSTIEKVSREEHALLVTQTRTQLSDLLAEIQASRLS